MTAALPEIRGSGGKNPGNLQKKSQIRKYFC